MKFSMLKKEFEKMGCTLEWRKETREYLINGNKALATVCRTRSEVEQELDFLTEKRNLIAIEDQELREMNEIEDWLNDNDNDKKEDEKRIG